MGGRRWCCSATSSATTTSPSRRRRPRWSASPMPAAPKDSSRWPPTRASSSGSIAGVRRTWQDLLERIDTTFATLQDHSTVVSWKRELKAPLEEIFAGLVFAPVLKQLNDIHARVLRSRVFIALHMHAGDGNVHTNIPVNSDHYQMLQDAHAAVARIMALARSLNGVISGEHGIGITKIEYLTADEMDPFRDYKMRIDPEGRFNKGKLLAGADLRNAYTPSFGLMGHE